MTDACTDQACRAPIAVEGEASVARIVEVFLPRDGPDPEARVAVCNLARGTAERDLRMAILRLCAIPLWHVLAAFPGRPSS